MPNTKCNVINGFFAGHPTSRPIENMSADSSAEKDAGQAAFVKSTEVPQKTAASGSRGNCQQLEMMAIEPPLSSSPIDEHHKDDHRDGPVVHRPVDQSYEASQKPASEFPDNVHLATLREKQFACEPAVTTMIITLGTGTQ
jgi:hypothetical protein